MNVWAAGEESSPSGADRRAAVDDLQDMPTARLWRGSVGFVLLIVQLPAKALGLLLALALRGAGACLDDAMALICIHAATASTLCTQPISTSLPHSSSARRRVAVRERRASQIPVRCQGFGEEDPSASSSGWNPADLVKVLGQNVWGRSLPPGALVAVVRDVWKMGWLTMMAQLAPPGEKKDFKRPASQFRSRPPAASAKPGQFHLYVALACPWAHRTAIVHALKGLGDAVPLSVAMPGSTGLWEFKQQAHSTREGRLSPTEDRANGKKRLVDVYKSQQGGYDGRSTVPMLWDSVQKKVVNNESADIIEILNSTFNHMAANPDLDLSPPHLKADIDRWNEIIYPNINNGVYRCGFAQGQGAYDSAVESLFATLDKVEQHLATSRYLCGDVLTLADVRLFTTLFRFDPVYQILFKCTKQKLSEYPHLHGYMRDIYQVPGVASTCDMDAIMHGYYKVLFPVNPGGISPTVPRVAEPSALLKPHNRHAVTNVAA